MPKLYELLSEAYSEEKPLSAIELLVIADITPHVFVDMLYRYSESKNDDRSENAAESLERTVREYDSDKNLEDVWKSTFSELSVIERAYLERGTEGILLWDGALEVHDE